MSVLTIENIKQDLATFSSLEEIAFKYCVDLKYLEKYIKEKLDIEAKDLAEQIYSQMKIEIRQMIIDEAREGNSSMITFLAKHYLPENKQKSINQLNLFSNPKTEEVKDLQQFSDLKGLNR